MMPPTATTQGMERSICRADDDHRAGGDDARNEATFNCCKRYSGDESCRKERAQDSMRTMQPKAIATGGRCAAERVRDPVSAFSLMGKAPADCGPGTLSPSRRRPRRAARALEERMPERSRWNTNRRSPMVETSARRRSDQSRCRAAEKGDAAQYDRGDREKRAGVCVGGGGFAGKGDKGQKESAQRGGKSRQQIGAEFGRIDRDADIRRRSRTSRRRKRRGRSPTGCREPKRTTTAASQRAAGATSKMRGQRVGDRPKTSPPGTVAKEGQRRRTPRRSQW